MRIRICNGHIVDPANNIDTKGDICIASGRIISVLDENRDFAADLTIDAERQLVIPGIVDLCARFREPGAEHKANIASESRAAASAGVTSVCYPPDTWPVIDTTSVVELIHQRAEANCTRIFPLGALTHGLEGERLAEMKTLMDGGCIGVSNGIQPVKNTEVLRRALEYAAGFDIPVFLYPEEFFLRNDGVIHEGAISTRLGLPPIPATAETVAVSSAILLMEAAGARLHLCRISAAGSIELVAGARAKGLPVSADASICHLHLCDTDLANYDTSRNLLPPLRGTRDRQALIDAVSQGVIDAICSDHQPHDDDAKSAPFSETEAGASTIEALLPLVLKLVDNGSMTLPKAIAALTSKPAGIMGIEHGTLGVNSPADITIVEMEAGYTITRKQLLSSGKNTPFDGWSVKGRVSYTLLGGKIIYQRSQL